MTLGSKDYSQVPGACAAPMNRDPEVSGFHYVQLRSDFAQTSNWEALRGGDRTFRWKKVQPLGYCLQARRVWWFQAGCLSFRQPKCLIKKFIFYLSSKYMVLLLLLTHFYCHGFCSYKTILACVRKMATDFRKMGLTSEPNCANI